MVKEFEDCPICGKRACPFLPEVGEGKGYLKENCDHLLWDPLRGNDFSKGFLEANRDSLTIRIPQFHTLNLDVVLNEMPESNRVKLEKILQDNLHEVNGWWFGTLDERKVACRELAVILKPISDHYSR